MSFLYYFSFQITKITVQQKNNEKVARQKGWLLATHCWGWPQCHCRVQYRCHKVASLRSLLERIGRHRQHHHGTTP